MELPAACVGDMTVCPLVTPGTPPVPHVGGPIVGPGHLNVLIGGRNAAKIGDTAVCTGPPDLLTSGSSSVMIGGTPAIRLGDQTAHGGVVTGPGCSTVLIG